MKFSVVVPVYEVEPYLCQCVDSILSQTDPDFELILVDDGSPDACPGICDGYQRQDPRVRVSHQANHGLSAARNAGIRMARGDYVLLLDSDDFWCSRDVLQEMRRLIADTQADLILFRVRAWREQENKSRVKTPPFRYDILDRFDRVQSVHYLLSEGNFPVGVYSCCVSRRLLTEHSICFAEGHKSEDYDWLFSILRVCQRIYATDSVHYVYRFRRKGSITSGADMRHLRDLMFSVSKWADAPGFSDPLLRQDIQNYVAYIYATALVLSGRFDRKTRGEAVGILRPELPVMQQARWRSLRLIRFALSLLGIRTTAVILQRLYRMKLKCEMK